MKRSNSLLHCPSPICWLSLKTGLARPGHVRIVLDITAVDIDLFFLYDTSTMIMYDSFSL